MMMLVMVPLRLVLIKSRAGHQEMTFYIHIVRLIVFVMGFCLSSGLKETNFV